MRENPTRNSNLTGFRPRQPSHEKESQGQLQRTHPRRTLGGGAGRRADAAGWCYAATAAVWRAAASRLAFQAQGVNSATRCAG